MADLMIELADAGCFVLMENPYESAIWKVSHMQRVINDSRFYFAKGNQCTFGLRGRGGNLMAKPTGWLTNSPILAQALSVLCPGQSERHVHEDVMGGNSKRAQVYPHFCARRSSTDWMRS